MCEEKEPEAPHVDWIETRERLPARLLDVLVVIQMAEKPTVDFGYRHKDEWRYTGSAQRIGTPVTHWAPSPEPPKEKMEQPDV